MVLVGNFAKTQIYPNGDLFDCFRLSADPWPTGADPADFVVALLRVRHSSLGQPLDSVSRRIASSEP
jgi:hypothetical protein